MRFPVLGAPVLSLPNSGAFVHGFRSADWYCFLVLGAGWLTECPFAEQGACRGCSVHGPVVEPRRVPLRSPRALPGKHSLPSHCTPSRSLSPIAQPWSHWELVICLSFPHAVISRAVPWSRCLTCSTWGRPRCHLARPWAQAHPIVDCQWGDRPAQGRGILPSLEVFLSCPGRGLGLRSLGGAVPSALRLRGRGESSAAAGQGVVVEEVCGGSPRALDGGHGALPPPVTPPAAAGQRGSLPKPWPRQPFHIDRLATD